MISKYEPNVKATIAFLRLLKIEVNNSTVDETLQNHPDWPSLLCISDALNKWNIPNAGGKIDVTEIDTLPTPFLAYTQDNESPAEIIAEITDKKVTLYSKEYKRPIVEDKEIFLKRWDGIYLIAEKLENSGEKNFISVKKKKLVERMIPTLLFVLLLVLSGIFLNQKNESFDINDDYPILLQYLILMGGVLVTTLLLWHEIDSNNPLLNKVCTGIIKGNCDAILSGKQSKLFSWLSWSEVGFFYFAGGLLTLLFASPITYSIAIISYLNLSALPYTVFSIYYQGRVAKQWCIFCLAVQFLLVLGGINILFNGLLVSLSLLPISIILKCILLYLTPVLLWFSVKPYILHLQNAKFEKRDYLRIKFNPEIFETLLTKQKQITKPMDGLGIDFGNPTATNILVKVCNPFCGPCSKAHPAIEELIENIPNLGIKIIFTTPNMPTLESFKIVNHLLAIDDQNEKYKTNQALGDWYLAEEKNYEKFAARYPLKEPFKSYHDKITAMFTWCNDINIAHTPTIFINGYQLPEAYNIEDLQYFLLE